MALVSSVILAKRGFYWGSWSAQNTLRPETFRAGGKIRWLEALAAKPNDLSSKPGTHSGGREPTPESCPLVLSKCMCLFSLSLSIINNKIIIIITRKNILQQSRKGRFCCWARTFWQLGFLGYWVALSCPLGFRISICQWQPQEARLLI